MSTNSGTFMNACAGELNVIGGLIVSNVVHQQLDAVLASSAAHAINLSCDGHDIQSSSEVRRERIAPIDPTRIFSAPRRQ